MLILGLVFLLAGVVITTLSLFLYSLRRKLLEDTFTALLHILNITKSLFATAGLLYNFMEYVEHFNEWKEEHAHGHSHGPESIQDGKGYTWSDDLNHIHYLGDGHPGHGVKDVKTLGSHAETMNRVLICMLLKLVFTLWWAYYLYLTAMLLKSHKKLMTEKNHVLVRDYTGENRVRPLVHKNQKMRMNAYKKNSEDDHNTFTKIDHHINNKNNKDRYEQNKRQTMIPEDSPLQIHQLNKQTTNMSESEYHSRRQLIVPRKSKEGKELNGNEKL